MERPSPHNKPLIVETRSLDYDALRAASLGTTPCASPPRQFSAAAAKAVSRGLRAGARQLRGGRLIFLSRICCSSTGIADSESPSWHWAIATAVALPTGRPRTVPQP